MEGHLPLRKHSTIDDLLHIQPPSSGTGLLIFTLTLSLTLTSVEDFLLPDSEYSAEAQEKPGILPDLSEASTVWWTSQTAITQYEKRCNCDIDIVL